ncbi:MAG: M67 family metallopeptidase [Cyanobacteria bacterium J06626_6]
MPIGIIVVLVLTQQHIEEMSAHAERVYPEECCGLMLGSLGVQTAAAFRKKWLSELVPLTNEWVPDVLPVSSGVDVDAKEANATSVHTKKRRYWVDPKDMLRVQREAREKGLNIIGVYHSHPDHVAEPSECDRALAWTEYAYIIVSVRKGKAVDVQNWALDSEHRFQPEAMEISPCAVSPGSTIQKVLLS